MRDIAEAILAYIAVIACVVASNSFDLPALFNATLLVLWPAFLARIVFLIIRRSSAQTRIKGVLVGATAGPFVGAITGVPIFFLGGLFLGIGIGLVCGCTTGFLAPNIHTKAA